MPIAFVDWCHNDSSQEPDVILTKAASLCHGSMVKNTSGSWHFFLSFVIMGNMMKKLSMHLINVVCLMAVHSVVHQTRVVATLWLG